MKLLKGTELKIFNFLFSNREKKFLVYCDMGAETRIVEHEEMAVTGQRHGKHISVAMNIGMQQQRNCWRLFLMQSM